jgi:hypothetical protein
LPVVALASAVTTSPASAVTTSPASTGGYGPPGSCFSTSVMGFCYLNNLDGSLYITGVTHNKPLTVTSTSSAADAFTFVSKDYPWGWLQLSRNPRQCWNEVRGTVYLDYCVTNDHNEYFDFESGPNPPEDWSIHNYSEGNTLNLAADKNGSHLYFTRGDNNTSAWYAGFCC